MSREIRQIGKFDPREHSARFGLDTGDESLTQQQFAAECDVNNIVRKFGLGNLPRTKKQAFYGDFTGISDYASAAEQLARTDAAFMELDPEVRLRFGNDPARFLAAVEGMPLEELEAFVRPKPPVSAGPPKSGPAGSDGSPEPVSPSGGDSGGATGG